MKVKRTALVLLLAAVAMGVGFVPAAAAGRQTWTASGDSSNGLYIMYKSNDQPLGEYVSILAQEELIWRADEAAQVAVGFGNDPWDAKVTVDGGSFDIYLSYLEGIVWNEEFETLGVLQSSNTWGTITQTDFIIPVGADFTVPEGAYLALKIVNTSVGPVDVLTYPGHTWLKSPTSDPAYPVPELSSVVLLGLGLAVLGASLGLRRWRLAKAA